MDIIATHIKNTPVAELNFRPYIYQEDYWMYSGDIPYHIIGGYHHGYKCVWIGRDYREGVLEVKDNDGGVIASSLVWLYAPR